MNPLSSLLSWSLNNRLMVLVGTALFVVVGIRSALTLPVDAVPDVTNVQVQVITSAPALSPGEVEQYVSVPVERAMSGIPRVTEVRSISKYGVSLVTVVFEDGTDIYFARQLVMERMRQAEEAVLSRYGRPEMGPISTGLGEIYQFTLQGEGHSLMELEELIHWYLGPQLRTVPGVVEVSSMGGESREYQVVVDPGRLQAAGLSVQEVMAALQRTNANAGGGYLERNREQLVIGTSGLVKSLEDLRAAVVGATPQGIPITVGNIGEVRFGPRLRRGAASLDGKGQVAVGVALMLMGENASEVTRAIKAKLETLRPSLPPGVTLHPFYDRSVLVSRVLHTVTRNLAEGAVLVVVVLVLLLGNFRAGLIVASVIPLAMLFAVSLMKATGISGNLMSLGAIDFGLIVDGAVIIVENSVRRLNEARRKASRRLSSEERVAEVLGASLEVARASVYGGVIIGIVYLPVLALRGVEGKLFTPMALTVLFALLGALVFSLTTVPVLASLFIVPHEGEEETWLMRKLHALYLPLLDRSFRHRRTTLLAGAGLLLLTLGVMSRLGGEFVPQLDEGDLLLEIRRLPGVALSESVRMDQRMQRAVLQIPEVRHAVSRTGAPEGSTDPMGIEETDIYLQLRPQGEWRKGLTREQLGEELAKALRREVPEVAVAISQPIQMRTNELIAGVRSDVAALLYGPDLQELQRLAEQIGDAVRAVRGAVDVRVEQGSGLNYLRIKPDRARLARYGLDVEDVNTLTETMAVGANAGMVLEKDRRFDLVVKMALGGEGDLEEIRALPLKSSSGSMVPLADVAEVSLVKGPAVVNRDRQSRRRMVEFNVRGRDLASVVEDAQAAVAKAVSLPTGYRVEWGGQFENFLSARRRLAWVVPLALGLILFLLWMAFHQLKPALLIFLNIPFAVVGGVWALWLRGLPFSISAGVGFIALFGVAVLNGLVLVSFVLHLEAEGMGPEPAVRRAAEMRLRPVMMTALVASLGFLPMALSTAPGSEVQRPLATVVIGGILSATALTLLLFPNLYAWVNGRRRT